MSLKPLVSVVIPYYNNEDTIKSCIVSIVEQTLDDVIEIIIIDDASERKEALVNIDLLANNYKRYIKVITFNDNKGGGAARNFGIKYSKGDFIAFMDSDDLWFKHKLEKQLNSYITNTILTSRTLKGIDIDNGVILPKKIKMLNESCGDALFVYSKLIQTSTFFMSSDVAKKVMFNDTLVRHQDYDFLLRAECLGFNIIQSNDVLSFWREDDSIEKKKYMKKNARSTFFINWFLNYRKYMTIEAEIGYISKVIFSSCMKDFKIRMFTKFMIKNSYNISFLIRVFVNIIKWRFIRVFKRR